MPVIDVHTHIFTRPWLELLKRSGGLYNIQQRPDGQFEVFRGQTPVVIPQAGHFDYDLRIAHMDAAGIDVSIMSLTCPNVFWGGEAVSCEAARETNDSLARAQARHPRRLRWFASLPWEYPARAVEELRRAQAEGASGVMVLANVAGRSLTDPAFAPIWEVIDQEALPVLVHPTDPPGAELMDMTQFDLSWAVGFMFDTTLAIARMMFDGFFDRFPRVPIIASHAGGALPYLAGRFTKGNEVEIPSRRKMWRQPIDYLRHIHYDCISYSPAALQFLISVVGADRVMFGTDWPHQVHDTAGAFANTAALPAEQREAVRGGNAERLFKL